MTPRFQRIADPADPRRPDERSRIGNLTLSVEVDLLPQARARTVLNWLRGRCVPDPKHPDGLINSIYYDSPDLSLLRAKVNSDFVKQKVRVRVKGKDW